MFSEQTLLEIRNRLSIVDLIQTYVPLKKAGTGFLGLCPFHKEKSPSFHVHPLKQCYYCFGCHKGGNIFTFLTAVEGITFPDAVRKLAEKTGVTIEEAKAPVKRERINTPQEEKVLKALDWASQYFHYLLTKKKEYESVLQYVYKRGISDKTIAKFNIGVAPKGWNTLQDLMLKRGFEFETLVTAGLVIEKEKEKGKGYDRFRYRLMFPIKNEKGIIVGFGGRILDETEKNQPKYLNSSESSHFSKRKILYGLFENQRGIRLRGEAILVEGYMDVVGLAEKEVDNAVATMGTATTDEHCYLLKKLTSRVVTVFDPDKAGQEAWKRSVEIFIQRGIFAKDLTLPDGLDPDEFVQKNGADVFYSLCENAPRQVTKLLNEIAKKGQLTEQSSGKILEDLTPLLVASQRLPDKTHLWDNLSLLLRVSPQTIEQVIQNHIRKNPQAPAKQENVRRQFTPPQKKKTLPPNERLFLQATLKWPTEFFAFGKVQWKEWFLYPRIGDWVLALSQATNEAQFQEIWHRLLQMEQDELILDAVTEVQVKEELPTLTGPDVLKSLYELMQNKQREKLIRSLTLQVRLSEKMGNSEEHIKLLQQLTELRKAPTI